MAIAATMTTAEAQVSEVSARAVEGIVIGRVIAAVIAYGDGARIVIAAAIGRRAGVRAVIAGAIGCRAGPGSSSDDRAPDLRFGGFRHRRGYRVRGVWCDENPRGGRP